MRQAGCGSAHMVIVSGDQKRLFTTNVASATVCILDQITVARRGGPPPGVPPPGAAGRGPTGRGSNGFPPSATDWNVTVVPVGTGAEGFDLSPNGRELWVANAQAGSVSIVDVTAKKLTETLMVAFRSANRLKFTPDGKSRPHLRSRWHRRGRDGRGDPQGNQANRCRRWCGRHPDVAGRNARVCRSWLSERCRDRRSEDASGQRPDLDRSGPRWPRLGYGE